MDDLLVQIEELKGRMNVLEQQRNEAMNRSAILGGQLSIALLRNQELEETVDADPDPEDG